MLNFFRQKSGSWVIQILLGLIILSFILFGISDVIFGPRTNNVISVGNIHYTIDDVQYYAQSKLARFLEFQDISNPNIIIEIVINEMIRDAIIKNELKNYNIDINEEFVLEHIKRSFKKDQGFDEETWNKFLERNNLARARLFDFFKDELLQTLFLPHFDLAVTPYKYISDHFENNSRIARNVTFIPIEYSQDTISIESQEIIEYYENNKENFKTDEKRSFEYLSISSRAIQDYTPSIEDLKNYYNTHKDEFYIENSRLVSQALFLTQKEAEEALQKNNLEFKSIGHITEDSVFDENIVKLIFATDKENITPVVASNFGYHVFRVDDILTSYTQSFEEVKSLIRNILSEEYFNTELNEFAMMIENLSFSNKSSLEQIAKDHDGVEYKLHSNLTKGHEIFNQEEIKNFVFNSIQGESSNIIYSNNEYALLKLLEISPPTTKEFGVVKQDIENILIKNKREHNKLEFAKQVQNEIVTQAPKNIKELKVILKNLNITNSFEEEITLPFYFGNMANDTRGNNYTLSNGKKISYDMLENLLQTNKLSTSNIYSSSNNVSYIGFINDIYELNENKKMEITEMDKGSLHGILKNEIFKNYIDYKKNQYIIEVDYDTIKQLLLR